MQADPPQVAFRRDAGEVERLQVTACMLRRVMRDEAKATAATLAVRG